MSLDKSIESFKLASIATFTQTEPALLKTASRRPMAGTAGIELKRGLLKVAAAILETRAEILPDDLTIMHLKSAAKIPGWSEHQEDLSKDASLLVGKVKKAFHPVAAAWAASKGFYGKLALISAATGAGLGAGAWGFSKAIRKPYESIEAKRLQLAKYDQTIRDMDDRLRYQYGDDYAKSLVRVR
jgi:hypothetical protein